MGALINVCTSKMQIRSSVAPQGAFVYTKLLHKIVDKHQSIQVDRTFLTLTPITLFGMFVTCIYVIMYFICLYMFSPIRVTISCLTKRNLKKANNWNIYVNKTNFPTATVHSEWVLLPA